MKFSTHSLAVVSLILAVLFAGCSEKSDVTSFSNVEKRKEDQTPAAGIFQYEFVLPEITEVSSEHSLQPACSTGHHEFESKPELCSALQDWALNNSGCAEDERKSLFEKECAGQFQETHFIPLIQKVYDGRGRLLCDPDKSVSQVYGTEGFVTREEYCAHLLDSSVFDRCAELERAKLFKRAHCEGEFPLLESFSP